MSKRGRGETCTYCKRKLESVTSRSQVAASRDHVVPRKHGGGYTVWACRQCNELKDDMLPEDWAAFMKCFPRWWAHPEFRHYGRAHSRVKPAPKEPQKCQSGTYSDTMFILKYGKKAWRARREAGLPIPNVEPPALWKSMTDRPITRTYSA